MLFLVPMLLMLFVGFAVNFDVKHIKLAVLDEDKTNQSREFIESFLNSDYFDYSYVVHSQKEINGLLDNGNVAVGGAVCRSHGTRSARADPCSASSLPI